jgi:Skp family chaperone for outer membrane proteins
MRKITMIAAGLVFVLVSVSMVVAQDVPKIGVFDPQRISEETTEGLRIQAELFAMRNAKQTELTTLQKAAEELQSQLMAQSLSLSPQKKQEMEIQLQKMALELQGAQESASRELQLEIGSAQNRFQDQLMAVIDQFSQQEGFDIILDRTMVAWVSPSVDITTALVDRFNETIKPPGAAAVE